MIIHQLQQTAHANDGGLKFNADSRVRLLLSYTVLRKRGD